MSFNYSVDEMPDFDQKWGNFPSDGKMYCVPTAYTNVMAFLSQNGSANLWRRLPSYAPGHSPKYSVQNIQYNIGIMADYMDTDAEDGTGFSDALDGIEDFVDDRFWGNWYSRSCSNDDTITLNKLKNHFEMKRIGAICYGRYERDNPNDSNSYDRMGGHCMTVVGLKINGSNATINTHDPNNDSNRTTQAATEIKINDAKNFSLKTDGDWRNGICISQSGGKVRMIDSYIIFSPMQVLHYDEVSCAITASSQQQNGSGGSPEKDIKTINVKNIAGRVNNLVMDAENTVAYFTSKDKKGIWKLSLSNMKVELINDALQPDSIAVSDEDGEIYASKDNKLFLLSDDKIVKEVAVFNEKTEAMTFDFKNRKLLAVSATEGRIALIDRIKKTEIIAIPKLTPNGKIVATINPKTGILHLMENSKKQIHGYTLANRKFKGVVVEELQTNGLISNLHVNDKSVFAAADNGKLQFFNATGKKINIPGWENYAVGELFKVSRNYNPIHPEIITTKKWKN